MSTNSGKTSSPRARRARRWIFACIGVASCCAGIALAQYRVNTQVNRQIYGNTSSSVRYGRSYQPNYAGQPTYNLLPSENRNLIYRSGALPSTLRMNYLSTGPLAPQGVAAYVPQQQSFRSSSVTAGNYVNTMSAARFNPTAGMPAVPTMKMPAAGSVRYATPAVGSASSAPWSQASVPTARMNATPQSGSIKYSWKL
jgi:hypothetical protein